MVCPMHVLQGLETRYRALLLASSSGMHRMDGELHAVQMGSLRLDEMEERMMCENLEIIFFSLFPFTNAAAHAQPTRRPRAAHAPSTRRPRAFFRDLLWRSMVYVDWCGSYGAMSKLGFQVRKPRDDEAAARDPAAAGGVGGWAV